MAVYNMTFSFLAYLHVNLISIKIGFLGQYYMPDTIAQVANACKVAKKIVRSLFEQAVHGTAISCSYRIFNSIEPPWTEIQLLVCLN